MAWAEKMARVFRVGKDLASILTIARNMPIRVWRTKKGRCDNALSLLVYPSIQQKHGGSCEQRATNRTAMLPLGICSARAHIYDVIVSM